MVLIVRRKRDQEFHNVKKKKISVESGSNLEICD